MHANACFFVGISTNGLLLWLVMKRTPSHLRDYSRILLQTVILNIVYLFSTVCYSSVTISNAYATTNYGQGWLVRGNDGTPFTRTRNFVLCAIWLHMVYYTQFAVVVPFIYRYFALCRGRVLSRTTYFCLLTFMGLLSGFQWPITIITDVSAYVEIMVFISVVQFSKEQSTLR